MLTRDLLSYRRRGEYLKLPFIDPLQPRLLETAARLLAIYEQALTDRMRREELEELLDPLLKGQGEPKLLGGLNKLILDGCEFSGADGGDYGPNRAELFDCSAAALSKGTDYPTYRATILAAAPWAAEDIYADLPQNERLLKMRRLFPRELLERYNVSLVQSLLLYADRLELTVADAEPAKLRRLFKYLKFFRLLATIRRYRSNSPRWKGKTALQLEISGPFALFDNSRKYGLQLACFFPAVCALQCWQLSAAIRLNGQAGKLVLDENSKLVSHYRNFSSYVPEEIAMFHKLFKEKIADWEIVGETPFLPVGGQEVIFPDLSFHHTGGDTTIHLELFHRWHYTQLKQRLAQLTNSDKTPALLLGIDRSLLKEEEFESLLAGYPQLQSKMFYFRDFPGVERVHKMLNLQLP